MTIEDQYPEFDGVLDLLVAPPNAAELREEWGEVDPQVLKRCEEMISPDVTRGAQYWMMRHNGSSDRFAAMVALQQGPGVDTDAVFFSDTPTLYEQFESQKHLDRYLKQAEAKGFRPNPQSRYFPELANEPGDPEAFVDRSQGRSYIRKLIEKRGGKLNRDMSVSWNEPESDPLAPENCKPLGEDIIRDKASRMIKKDPNLKRLNRKALRERIISKHGPQ